MNENATNINYGTVKKSVETIESCSTTMKNIFEDFGTSVKEVLKDDNFSGEASETFEGRYNELKTKFDSYVETVNRFAAMLEFAGDRTRATEKNISDVASNLSA